MHLALIVIGWLVCSFFAWGLTLGYFTEHYPYMNNKLFALVMSLLGPAGLFAALICGHSLAFRLKPLNKEQRWKIFKQKYDCLDRAYFEEKY